MLRIGSTCPPLALLIGLITASAVHAEDHPPEPGIRGGDFMPLGLTLGFYETQGHQSFQIGAEISRVTLDRDADWAGLYLASVIDTDSGALRISAGPEIGHSLFGLDGGPILEVDGADLRFGGRLRGTFSFFVFHAYIGGGGYLDGDGFSEVGWMFKWPFELESE